MKKQAPTANFFEESKGGKVSASQQIMTLDWAEDVRISSYGTIKSESNDIILCALEVKKNQIAIGGKDGILTIFDASSGHKIASLKGHKASICSLALVNHQGKIYLASGSDHGCSSISLWDLTTWNMKMKL
jgi:WD40 repeat protein